MQYSLTLCRRPGKNPGGALTTIDWNAFTPWSALAGGMLIGLATALYVLLNGRIAGVSGVLGGLLRPQPAEVAWRLAFVIGLAITPALFWLFGHRLVAPIATSYGGLMLAGFATVYVTRHILGL